MSEKSSTAYIKECIDNEFSMCFVGHFTMRKRSLGKFC